MPLITCVCDVMCVGMAMFAWVRGVGVEVLYGYEIRAWHDSGCEQRRGRLACMGAGMERQRRW
jgi:hypothetical protein